MLRGRAAWCGQFAGERGVGGQSQVRPHLWRFFGSAIQPDTPSCRGAAACPICTGGSLYSNREIRRCIAVSYDQALSISKPARPSTSSGGATAGLAAPRLGLSGGHSRSPVIGGCDDRLRLPELAHQVHRAAGKSRNRAIGRQHRRLVSVPAGPHGRLNDRWDHSNARNALAEAITGPYKTERVHRQRPWRNMQDLEMATRAWVD